MSDEAERVPSMALTGSLYQTQTTQFIAGVAGVELVLPADSRRLWVRFQADGAIAVASPLLPAPYPVIAWSGPTEIFPQEYKWRDCPSVVAGEWYADYGPGSTLIITECLYVGEA